MTNPLNIFVIDDSEDDRLLYRRALQKDSNIDYKISESDNGEDGVGRVAEEQPDCILLDYSMPGYSGVEVLKRIRGKYPFIAVVMLTGHGDTMVAVNAMKEGAQDYLPKDTITSGVLQKSVQTAIEKIELLKQLYTQNEKLKETNLRLQAANQEAAAAAKAKNEFLANMSHELRTPMNSVLGMSELLLTTTLNAKQEKFANAIYNSGTMMLDLVSDILDFAKIEVGELKLHPEYFILFELIEEVSQLFERNAAERHIKFNLDYDKNIPHLIEADRVRLRQVIVNLVGNAIKFTHDGSVTVKITELSRENSKTSIRFEVKDTGIGIPEDKQLYIFEKFTQIDSSSSRKYGGTGLGLSICKNLMRLMGGNIGVMSDPGKGSTFWFEIVVPMMEQDIQPNNIEEKGIEEKGSNDNSKVSAPMAKDFRAHLLVAEDNTDNQVLIQEMLEFMGCHVSISKNGQEALKAIEENQGKYDIVIMDCQMPEIDGYELTKIIRTKLWGKTLPIVAMTAHALYGDRRKCLESGMNDYISKPARMVDIERILRKYVKINT